MPASAPTGCSIATILIVCASSLRRPIPFCVRGELLPAPAVAIVGTREPTRDALTYTTISRSGSPVAASRVVGRREGHRRGGPSRRARRGRSPMAVVATVSIIVTQRARAALRTDRGERRRNRLALRAGASADVLFTFHHRNGVLAALTPATVVVQAPHRERCASTAAHARRLRRPLFVLPASPWDGRRRQPRRARSRARPLLTRRTFKLLGAAPERALAIPKQKVQRGPELPSCASIRPS